MKTSTWVPKKLLGTGKVWMIGLSLGIMELLSLGIMTNLPLPRMVRPAMWIPTPTVLPVSSSS